MLINLFRILGWALTVLVLLFAGEANATVITIDPGHEPAFPGASGTCGKKEFEYNDQISSQLKRDLHQDAYLTRQPFEPVSPIDLSVIDSSQRPRNSVTKSLYYRAAFANKLKADLFISIHHDSTSQRHIIHDSALCKGSGGKTLASQFKKRFVIGFNIFVNENTPVDQYEKSLKFARLLSTQMIAIGRRPSNYHYYPVDDCHSCRPIDSNLGVWHQDLIVLKLVKMPAVLVEVGNIVDSEDEATISQESFRKSFSMAVQNAIDEYFRVGPN